MRHYHTRSDLVTGSAPTEPPTERNATEKELVELWYVKPLERMSGDDAFACLTICFPLIEAIIRHELAVPDDQDVVFSDGSPALQWFARFMSIPEAHARSVWDGLRNGLLHRAMIKSDIDYELTPDRSGRVAEIKGATIHIHVWELRDAVISHVRRLHRKLWKGSSSPLPRVYLRQ